MVFNSLPLVLLPIERFPYLSDIYFNTRTYDMKDRQMIFSNPINNHQKELEEEKGRRKELQRV